MTDPKIGRISWDEYHNMILDIADQITSNKEPLPDEVVAIGRGGFVPGVHLSHLLGIPLRPLMWQTRDLPQDIKDTPTIAPWEKRFISNVHSLIVDDINDSGKTLTQLTTENIWNDSVSVAVLMSKTISEFKAVDYYSQIADNDVWYVFPWEH